MWQWAELWLYPVCLMLHAGFATVEHMQEEQKVLFLLLLEFLLLTSHWRAYGNLITGQSVWIYTTLIIVPVHLLSIGSVK